MSRSCAFKTLRGVLFALPLCLLLMATPVQASDEPPALTQQQAAQRIEALDKSFAAQRFDASLWEYGWLTFNGGSMLWSSIQASQDNSTKNRNADIISAVESFLGVADLVFRPLPVLSVSSACQTPQTTMEDLRRCLAEKEEISARQKARWDERYAFWPHAEILGFNLAAGGAVWGLASFQQALIMALSGEVIGEIQLWTIPSQGAKDDDAYRLQFGPLIHPKEKIEDTTLGLRATLSF